MLNSFPDALCSCCTVFMLHLFVCCTAFMLHLCSCCLMLYSVHVALFRHSGQKLYKKRPNHRCFPAKFVRFLRTPILKNICEQLLLKSFSKTVSMSKSLYFITVYSDRSSCSDVFCKKGVLRNFAKFTGKHVCQGLFFIKLQASSLKPATLLKKRLWR